MHRSYAVGAVLLGSEVAVGCEATVAAHSAMTEVTDLSHLHSTRLCWHQSVLAPGYAAWGYKAIFTACHLWP